MVKTAFTSDLNGHLIETQTAVFGTTTHADMAVFETAVPTLLIFAADVTSGDVTIKAGTTFTLCTEVYTDNAYHFTGVIHSRSANKWFVYEASLRSDNSWELSPEEL